MWFRVFLFFVLAMTATAFFLWNSYQQALTTGVINNHSPIIEIKKGDSFNQISETLLRQNVEIDPIWFKLIAYKNKVIDKLKAGEYQLKPGMTMPEILSLMKQGRSRQYAITFPEGWSFKQIFQALKHEPNLKQTLEYEQVGDFLKQIGAEYAHPEGLFFPDTYFYEKNTTDVALLTRSYNRMKKVLAEEWQNKASDLPIKSPYEALILASIIEKETGAASERKMISGVFTRRLNIGMLLQTDPTVIYGMGDNFKGDIRYKDLRQKTDYNTYIIKGLPPTPIAMPGQKAINAALHPEDGNSLYFVAKGDGSHHFSATLREHNNAVNKYQRKR